MLFMVWYSYGNTSLETVVLQQLNGSKPEWANWLYIIPLNPLVMHILILT